ncbi:sphingomyelin phosphodiesterase-like [Prorops nasuta]|uniref:sphingomyelin phosphodiesterase-like n=1 Tax=Prorops nasuta TaxID=863751 RepID=UPI0034CE6846
MQLHIIFTYLLLFFATSNAKVNVLKASDVAESALERELQTWMESNEETDSFKQMIELFKLPTSLQRKNYNYFTGERHTVICKTCIATFKVFIQYRRDGKSAEDILTRASKLCKLLNLQKENVCEGLIQLNGPIILRIIDLKPNITAVDICGVMLEHNSCSVISSEFEWTVNIDTSPAKTIRVDDTNKILKLLQLTDIHYDPKYEVNGNAECGEPACCRIGQNVTNDKGKLAGYWGDYNHCDSPWHAVTDVLDHINSTHKDIEYVYFTGDIIDHGVWETAKDGNVEILTAVYSKIHETFNHTKVFPVIGNHESHPPNVFAPGTIKDDRDSMEWLYRTLADLWIGYGWLPESTRATVLKGGYYTVSPRQGFRIISLNNNLCYVYNWWLFYQPQDPSDQLQWLADTLLKAENDAEFVHILAHIPPGDADCFSTCRREYLKIINRFKHIVTAQFNGHTHNDELQVIYEAQSLAKPINVAWNGGSTTTFANLNPNYKIYSLNVNSMEVKDFDNWMYNLTQANETPDQRPKWYKSYSFKEEYKIPEITLQSLHNWLQRISIDENMLNLYHRNFMKYADPALEIPCSSNCLKDYINRIIVNRY